MEHKVVQICADSTTFDRARNFSQRFDHIFTDGSHDNNSVKIDSANALQWVADDGFVVWHDYQDLPEITFGVRKRLHEFRREYHTVRVAGTSLCVFRNSGQASGKVHGGGG